MATAIEYGLIAALVAVAAIGATQHMSEQGEEQTKFSLALETTINGKTSTDVVDRGMTAGDCAERLKHGERKTWDMGKGAIVTSQWACLKGYADSR